MKSDMMSSAVMLVVILMVIDLTSTLTTFGTNKQTDTDQNKTVPPAPVSGRICKLDSECSGIQNTLCMRDMRDNKMRCLCVNKSTPKNGACPRSPKHLNSVCINDKECMFGAECATSNTTIPHSNTKTCMCKEGFLEEDHVCNSGFLSAAPSIITLIVAFSFLRLAATSE